MKTRVANDKKIYDNYLKYSLETSKKPDTTLGIWVINHRFKSKKNDENLEIKGEYEVNVWYSYDNNTKTDVATKKIEYNEIIPKIFNETSDYYLRCLGNPSCNKTNIENNIITLEIFKQFEIEIIDELEIIEDKPKKMEHIDIQYWSDEEYTPEQRLNVAFTEIDIIIDKLNYLLEKSDSNED